MSKEREAFEEVFPCSTGTVLNEYGHYESQVNQQDAIIQNISWVVWQAAKAQAVPEGFVLVSKNTLNKALNPNDYDEDVCSANELLAVIEAQQPSSASDCPDEP